MVDEGLEEQGEAGFVEVRTQGYVDDVGPLIDGPGEPCQKGPHGRFADGDTRDEEAGRRRDADRDALGRLPAGNRVADVGAVPPGVEGRLCLDPTPQRVDQDELLDPAGQRGVVAMEARVEGCDVDILALGRVPDFRARKGIGNQERVREPITRNRRPDPCR